MLNVPSTSTSVSSHKLLREIEQRDHDEELDDSDEDPDYIPSEESDNESGPENSDEDLLQNEDEYLVIENYVDGQVDEFFGEKMKTFGSRKNLQPKEELHTQIFYKDPYLDLQ